MTGNSQLKIAIAQIAPVWLSREPTLAKVADWVQRAATRDCDLVVFGEALVPGYPFWLERTDAARFDSSFQKSMFAHYAQEAVTIDEGHLDPVCDAARRGAIRLIRRALEEGLRNSPA